MRCASCGKENLPGGVRCIYCGAHYPKVSEFDLDIPEPKTTSTQSSTSANIGKKRGLWASFALLAFKAKSLFALFKIGKVFITFGTMLLSIAAYAHIFGWKFGVGFVIIIFIHEMGHVIVNNMKGLKQSAPVFIPFMGAVIFLKNFPDDPTIQSESGAGGPAAGMLAALICLAIGMASGNPYWMALANIGFIMNLFNLIPFPPLDGSHISTVFSPKIWSGILITLLLWVIKFPSPMLWMVLLVSFIFRLGRNDVGRHQLATPQVQFRMGIVFILLCVILSSGAVVTGEFSINKTKSQSVSSSQFSTSTNGAVRSNLSANRTHSAFRQLYRLIFYIVVFIIPSGMWFASSLLLSMGAGRGVKFKHFYMAFHMSLFQLGVQLFAHYGSLSDTGKWQLIGASFAAGLAAFIFAAYQAFHLSSADRRPTFSSLVRGTLAWAAFGAFLVAYAFSSLAVAILLLAVIGGYLLLHKWVVFSMQGNAMIQLGRREQAISYFHRALVNKPNREDAVMLWNKIASTHIVLDHGADTLKALANRDLLLAGSENWERESQIGIISDLYLRGSALMLMDRHQESLVVCEQILQAPVTLLPNGNSRLLLTHIRLAKIARLHGWMDETLAQADMCLGAISKRTKDGIAGLHCLKAAAYIEIGDMESAKASCDLAASQTAEAYYSSWVSVLRTQIDLKTNLPGEAIKQIARAMRLIPDNLEFRYWYGRTLIADGKRIEGENILNEMRQRFPEEHWGKLAGAALLG